MMRGMGIGIWVEVVGRREGVGEGGSWGGREWYSSRLVFE